MDPPQGACSTVAINFIRGQNYFAVNIYLYCIIQFEKDSALLPGIPEIKQLN